MTRIYILIVPGTELYLQYDIDSNFRLAGGGNWLYYNGNDDNGKYNINNLIFSLQYTFDKKNAEAPSTHKTQYFEMIGDHAIYHDGWMLSTKVMRVPWDSSATSDKHPENWPWELYDLSSGLGKSGTGYLKVDGKVVATNKMQKTIPMTMQWDENFDVGADTGSPVNDNDYKTPFRFTGKLNKLILTIDRPKLSKEDIKKLEDAMHSNPASE